MKSRRSAAGPPECLTWRGQLIAAPGLPLAPDDHIDTNMASAMNSPNLDDLGGKWARLLLVSADGTQDRDTSVTWLQGPTRYADLRQPSQVRDFAHVRGLRDLTFDDCIWLARQQGFAGMLRIAGDCFEWVRELDFQPPGAHADIGRLFWRHGLLIEEGRDIPYIEHWHRDSSRARHPSATLTLRSPTGAPGSLIRVGNDFMYARARDISLPDLPDLAACIRADPPAAQALVNCEISCGAAAGAQWRITRSTLPFRVGDDLAPAQRADDEITVADRDEAGAPIYRHWSITAREGDPFFV